MIDADALPRLQQFLGTREPLEIEQFKGGYSNLTYLVRAGSQQWVLRRPPVGSTVKTAHDMGREYNTLVRLRQHFDRVPRPIAYCEDDSIIGAPFYVMERVDGIILRNKVPPGVDLNPSVMRRLSENAIDTLVAIHALPVDEPGRAHGYVHRQVTGWTERWNKARTHDVPGHIVDEIAAWLAAHEPADPPASASTTASSGTAPAACLIHNDYKYDNLVVDPQDPTHIKAVLDWEMSTIGDPWMDVGLTLAYWIQADDPAPLQQLGLGLTMLPGNLTRAEVIERYVEKSGRVPVNPTFYHVFGMFKVIGIAQQIYFRYKAGKTNDPRFAALGQAVAIMASAALNTAQKS
jgi:aminoglycoside phosphotransferase (APT) family kinase protein